MAARREEERVVTDLGQHDHSINFLPLKRRKEDSFEKEECIAEKFIDIETKLCKCLCELTFEGPVQYVYNPLEYASEPHKNFVNKYCTETKRLLFVGMNPGPFGMAQNGVPFGDTNIVSEWLQIDGQVRKPSKEHPKRPILGLECKRSEVSGSRLWGFIKDYCKTPDVFFRNCFIHNYCPLVFMTETGKNITPPNLPIGKRKQLYEICDKALIETVKLLEVDIVVGVGKFAEGRSRMLVESLGIKVFGLMHPSPASPAANAGWHKVAHQQLNEAGLLKLLV